MKETSSFVPLYNILRDTNGHTLGEFHINKLRYHIYPLINTPSRCISCSFLNKCGGGCYTRRTSNALNEDYCCSIFSSTDMETEDVYSFSKRLAYAKKPLVAN
jgi:MoaA/NifB/PqqE/SkfB family radical SAM enzyme